MSVLPLVKWVSVPALVGVVFSVSAFREDSGVNAFRLMSLGRALRLYVDDYDGLLPQAQLFIAETNTWSWNRLHDVPITKDIGSSKHFSYWTNAVRPYGRVQEAFAIEGAPDKTMGSQPVSEIRIGWTLNGLLHRYPMVSIVEPRRLPLLWMGYGKVNLVGRSGANPVLMCMMPKPECVYGTAGPQGIPHLGGGTPMMMHGEPNLTEEGAPFLSADLTLTWLELGADLDADGFVRNRLQDPYAWYSGGKPMGMWVCDVGASKYPCFFRPDFDYKTDRP